MKTAIQPEEAQPSFDWYRDNDVQRVSLPLDVESRRMLDELVAWLYPDSAGTQRKKYRGRVAKLAIRMLHRRTMIRRLSDPPH